MRETLNTKYSSSWFAKKLEMKPEKQLSGRNLTFLKSSSKHRQVHMYAKNYHEDHVAQPLYKDVF